MKTSKLSNTSRERERTELERVRERVGKREQGEERFYCRSPHTESLVKTPCMHALDVAGASWGDGWTCWRNGWWDEDSEGEEDAEGLGTWCGSRGPVGTEYWREMETGNGTVEAAM